MEFPQMNYKHFCEKNAKFHIFLFLSIIGGISLITIYDRKFRHNRPEEGLPKMITYISPINMVAEDNHLYFAYKSPLGSIHFCHLNVCIICSVVDKSLHVQLECTINLCWPYTIRYTCQVRQNSYARQVHLIVCGGKNWLVRWLRRPDNVWKFD